MASKKKKSSGRRSSTRNTKTSTRSRSSAPGFRWGSEVLLFVVLIFCVILFISNFGLAGNVGMALSGFFFGMLGVIAYAFPVALFALVTFLVLSRDEDRRAKYHYPGRRIIKTVASVGCLIFVCVIAHVIYFRRDSYGLVEIYHICSLEEVGGGFLGAMVGKGMCRGLGVAATVIISVIVLVLCVVLISERSLFQGVYKRYNDSRSDTKSRSSSSGNRREPSSGRAGDRERDIGQEQYETRARRRDRKASGTLTDVDLKSQAGVGSDSSERKYGRGGRMSEVNMTGAAYDDGFEEEYPLDSGDGPTIYVSGQETEPEEKPEEAPQKPAAKRASAPKKTSQSMQEVTAEVAGITEAIAADAAARHSDYIFPSIRLLSKGDPHKAGDSRQHLQQMSKRLQDTLETFGVNARVTNVVCGPSVTQYEIQPEMGVKVSKILSLADDIKLNLMVSDIRIEAPIPGKAAIGIEVPNSENVTVALRDLIESPEFQNEKSPISFCVGKDIAGHVIVADIAKMPHLLIAGATGSGKSVCINTIITSILYKATPDEVKLIMIDPKVVELSVYNDIPHLLIPVVTDPKKAAGALHWAVAEMTDRYNKFAEFGVRDIDGYNKKVESMGDVEGEDIPQKMPNIVIIVDELSDLMMVAAGDVEDAICRLAQLARAAGIHLIIATQRPSVNVITGLIKANMPSRIAFAVTSGVDSRTIIDMNGAEKLLGKGDMLLSLQEYAKPLRVQGAFVSDSEVSKVVDDIISKNGQGTYNSDVEEKVTSSESALGTGGGFPSTDSDRDQLFDEAARFLIEKETGSIGMLQRNFRIGFNRAARIMDQLEEAGVVAPEEGKKPRRVLMTMEEFENLE